MGKFSTLYQFVSPSNTFWRLRHIAQAKAIINSAFTKYLLLTNVSVSMALSGFGDVLQQRYMLSKQHQTESLSRSARSYDVVRTANMTISGATVGTLCHYWYQRLDRALPGRSLKVIMKKLTVDQVVFSPVCLCVFLLTLEVARRATESVSKSSMPRDTFESSSKRRHSLPQEIHIFTEELRHKGALLYVTEWIVWPPAQFINFYFLSTRFRVLYDNTISLLYDAGSSYICNDMAVEDVKLLADKARQTTHTIGETLAKPAVLKMANIMLRKEAEVKLSQITLSNDTISDRIEDMSRDILAQVVADLISSPAKFSLQLDETTDLFNLSQLAVFVRIVKDDVVKEDFLFSHLADIFAALNHLNRKMQGGGFNIIEAEENPKAFQKRHTLCQTLSQIFPTGTNRSTSVTRSLPSAPKVNIFSKTSHRLKNSTYCQQQGKKAETHALTRSARAPTLYVPAYYRQDASTPVLDVKTCATKEKN
ncbi:Mpv17/PMP22 [Trinorchestia longiramus]|nr:Mpv17/PMP22 [Trinorchestia longiramus]